MVALPLDQLVRHTGLYPQERFASMSKKQLRIEAESRGVPLDVVDQFRDGEMTKARFVDILASLSKVVARQPIACRPIACQPL